MSMALCNSKQTLQAACQTCEHYSLHTHNIETQTLTWIEIWFCDDTLFTNIYSVLRVQDSMSLSLLWNHRLGVNTVDTQRLMCRRVDIPLTLLPLVWYWKVTAEQLPDGLHLHTRLAWLLATEFCRMWVVSPRHDHVSTLKASGFAKGLFAEKIFFAGFSFPLAAVGWKKYWDWVGGNAVTTSRNKRLKSMHKSAFTKFSPISSKENSRSREQ